MRAPEPLWKFWRREKSLATDGFRTPDRPARKPSHYIDYGVLTAVKGWIPYIFVFYVFLFTYVSVCEFCTIVPNFVNMNSQQF